jgi:carboxypeptidase Q
MTNEARRRGGGLPWAAAILIVAMGVWAGAQAGAQSPGGTAPAPATAAYEEAATRIVQKGLRELGAYATLAKLLSAGPRLTGSAEADAAVALMADHMKALGFDNVRTEPTTVGHWVRGAREEGFIVSKAGGRVAVNVRAIGNSIGTPPGGLEAGVIEVRSLAEVAEAADRVKGRIVFFNGAMDPTHLDTFAAYGGAAQQRSGGAVAAARAGAVGVVVRSLTLRLDDDPHTGMMSYDAATPKIPAVMISTNGAERLSAMLASEPGLRFRFRTSSETLPPVTSHNVMGELRGSERPDEVIVVGGHIDSWDLSPGAHDDGAGCAQAVEALRLLRELGLRPKRTIRAVLYMDEENGGTGGRDYARSPNRAAERHVAAIESDRGGFLPIGIGAGGKGATYERVKGWEPLFQRIGLQWVRPGGGGVDIAPLAAAGTVMMGLIPDSQRYFDVHHSGSDTLQAVHPRELELGATAMALLAYLVAQEGFPPQ